jgi:hypothetical protein
MEVSGQLHAPAALPQGKSLWYPLDRRLSGLQRRSRNGGEDKNCQPLPGLEPPTTHPAHRPALYHSAILAHKLKNDSINIHKRTVSGYMKENIKGNTQQSLTD